MRIAYSIRVAARLKSIRGEAVTYFANQSDPIIYSVNRSDEQVMLKGSFGPYEFHNRHNLTLQSDALTRNTAFIFLFSPLILFIGFLRAHQG
jgi:hypothetical protein